MLHLITGVPGSCKTAFVVTEIDKVEKSNKVNLVKNKEIFAQNKALFEKYRDDFTYREYDVGSGHELKNEIEVLSDDYFDFLEQDFDDLRPDFYYQRTVHYNEIVQRIVDRFGETEFKTLFPVRTIYTNINALKIDYVRALVDDWRGCPDGSIIVIDEVQLVKPFSDLKDKNNSIIQDLTIHRHRGFDFYFITQYPSLLHPTVKVLVGVHYHLTRPYGMTTVVYQYGSAKDNPNAIVNRLNKENRFFFTPAQRIFKLYKSTTINTHKKRIPTSIFFFLFWVAAGIAFFIYNLSGDEIENSATFGDGVKKEVVVENKEKTVSRETQSEIKKDNELTKEQLEEKLKLQEQQFKLELEKQKMQMIMQYEQMQQQFIEQQEQMKQFQRKLELFKSQLPADYNIIKENTALQVRAVVKMKDKCKAYNTHGDLMTLTFEECDYYLQEAGRVHKSNGQTVNQLQTESVAQILEQNPNSHIHTQTNTETQNEANKTQ